MHVKCRVFISITIKNTSRLCKMLLIKLIGEFYGRYSIFRWYAWKLLLSTLSLIANFLFLSSAQLTKAYQTANVLFEVLKAVNTTQSLELDREVKLCYTSWTVIYKAVVLWCMLHICLIILWLTFDKILDVQDKVAEKTEYYVPYNILPLDPDSANQAIMRYPEVLLQFSYFLVSFSTVNFFCTMKYCFHHLDLQIQAAVLALRNTRGLPWPKDYQKKKDEDILDWLQAMFGFQVIEVTGTVSLFFQCSWVGHDIF